MRIKLAILDSDRNYLEKMSAAFARCYSDDIEFYLFTVKQAALEELARTKIDVFLINKSLNVSPEEIPSKCLYAYLSDTFDGEIHNNRPVICKFQKMEMIYKQILDVCAEGSLIVPGRRTADSNEGKVILFLGASGGVGTSSLAAACAVRFARNRKKVLYLNLQKFAGADLYFSGEGQRNMSDLILSLQDPDAKLQLQLQSWVRRDETGVMFFAQAKNPLDMMELDSDTSITFLTELRRSGAYDYIILDMDLVLDQSALAVYRYADELVMVGDHSYESSAKAGRVLNALRTLDRDSDRPVTSRISVMYNRVSSANKVDIDDQDVSILGFANVYKTERGGTVAQNRQVIEILATMEMFDKIM